MCPFSAPDIPARLSTCILCLQIYVCVFNIYMIDKNLYVRKILGDFALLLSNFIHVYLFVYVCLCGVSLCHSVQSEDHS